eukprot:g27773.t1
MDGRLASVMVWTVHTIFRSLWSWAQQLPYQAVMHPDSILSNGTSKVEKVLYGHAKFPELPEEEEVLLSLLDYHIDMRSPGQVVGYHHSKEFDTLHPLNLHSIDGNRAVFSFLSARNDLFFGFANFERGA